LIDYIAGKRRTERLTGKLLFSPYSPMIVIKTTSQSDKNHQPKDEIMIIHIGIEVKDYSEKTKDKTGEIDKTVICDCPNCHARQSAKYYCTYWRHALVFEMIDGILEMVDHHLEIIRVECNSCDTTHAILPWDAIPYKQCSLTAFLLIMRMTVLADNTLEKAPKRTRPSSQFIYEMVCVWKEFWASVSSLLRVAFQTYLETEAEVLRFILNNTKTVVEQYIKHNKWGIFSINCRTSASDSR
jgi:hypothetical protein